MVSKIFNFHPYLGKISNLTNVFQMGWNHQPVLQLWMNWHHLNSSLRIDEFLFRNWFLSFFWWITFNPAAKHAMPKPPNTAPEPPGLFGNLNLRSVGHAPEALDRVITEGDVTWFKSLDPWNQPWESAELRSYTRATGYLPHTPWPTWSF